MRVNQLAKKLDVSPDTVRFYTRVGLLQPNPSPDNGYNLYDAEDEKRLKFAVNARQLGFSVEDILEIVSSAAQGKIRCPAISQLIQRRLQDNTRRFQESVLLRNQLLKAINEWGSRPNKPPNGKSIESLLQDFVLEGGG